MSAVSTAIYPAALLEQSILREAIDRLREAQPGTTLLSSGTWASAMTLQHEPVFAGVVGFAKRVTACQEAAAWANVVQSGQYVELHDHVSVYNPADACAVYYPFDTETAIIFECGIEARPRAGTLLSFAPSLRHAVEQHHSTVPRYSIALNLYRTH